MPAQVAAGTRKIWTKNDTTNTLNNFNSSNTDLTPYFTGTKLANLSQWSSLSSGTTSQQTDAVTNIVNYLRGDKTYEGILFRERAATFGDAVESQPAFIGKSTFNYVDAGYGTFKSDNATRIGMVYIGANDGMMHAFYAKDEVTPPTGTKCVVGGGTYCGGEEAWAYVPSMVIPNMFELADTDYANEHMYYANGSPVISDVYDPVGAKWRTILVAGLNAGGRGYYALDITKPKEPILLWEFTPANDDDLGFTYGKPVITKKSNGDWVVLVTSGYNNVPDVSPRVKYPQYTTHGDGVGYLYVLDAVKGPTATFGKISTGEGTTSIPSGLAQINAWAEEAEKNNTTTYIYGGDLLGNVWRFDINDGSSGSMMKFAKLLDNTTPTKTGQPITTRPELGKVLTSDGKTHRVVFIGTGKYLEGDDLADKQLQTLYAIKDDNNTLTPDPFLDPRTQTTLMVKQTMVNDSANASRSIPTPANPAADFINGRGWFIDFTDPTGGERQNVASQLVLGTLLVPTTVPSNTACAPGGTSWLNFFDYRTGAAVIGSNGKQVSTKFDAPIVGINVIYIPDPTTGKPIPKVSVVTADNPTPQIVSNAPFSASGSGFQKKRVIWRELINE
jgi:type IV pilus assembly protein PilY1